MKNGIQATEINVTRLIDASPSVVFKAWLDHTSPGSPWFGVPKAIVYPPQVDSLFYSMYRIGDREIAHYGRFTLLEEPYKLQHTWVSEATHGVESIVTLTFEPVEDKTRVHVNHAKVPDDEGGRHHENAWKYVLSKMKSRFANGGAH